MLHERTAARGSFIASLQRYNKLDFSDLDRAFDDLLNGEKPTNLLSDRNTPILTFGSCFAERLSDRLLKSGYSPRHMPLSEFLNTPLVNLALIDAVVKGLENSTYRSLLTEVGGEVSLSVGPAALAQLHEALSRASIVVFTVGVGLLWRERRSGAVVLQPAKRRLQDYETYYPSPRDQAIILEQIVGGIRELNREATVWITLSPVPVETSLNYASAVVSDCVSKSTLRVAIHQLMNGVPENVRYFPSFEFVRWISGHVAAPAFGDDGVVRHVNDAFVEVIVRKFVELNGGRTS